MKEGDNIKELKQTQENCEGLFGEDSSLRCSMLQFSEPFQSVLDWTLVSGPACKEFGSHHSILTSKKLNRLKINKSS